MNEIINENKNLSQQFQNLQSKQHTMLENIEEEIQENSQKLEKMEKEVHLVRKNVEGLILQGLEVQGRLQGRLQGRDYVQ